MSHNLLSGRSCLWSVLTLTSVLGCSGGDLPESSPGSQNAATPMASPDSAISGQEWLRCWSTRSAYASSLNCLRTSNELELPLQTLTIQVGSAQPVSLSAGGSAVIAILPSDSAPVDLAVAFRLDASALTGIEREITLQWRSQWDPAALTWVERNPLVLSQPFSLWPISVVADASTEARADVTSYSLPLAAGWSSDAQNVLSIDPAVVRIRSGEITRSLFAADSSLAALNGSVRISARNYPLHIQLPGAYVLEATGLRVATSADMPASKTGGALACETLRPAEQLEVIQGGELVRCALDGDRLSCCEAKSDANYPVQWGAANVTVTTAQGSRQTGQLAPGGNATELGQYSASAFPLTIALSFDNIRANSETLSEVTYANAEMTISQPANATLSHPRTLSEPFDIWPLKLTTTARVAMIEFPAQILESSDFSPIFTAHSQLIAWGNGPAVNAYVAVPKRSTSLRVAVSPLSGSSPRASYDTQLPSPWSYEIGETEIVPAN